MKKLFKYVFIILFLSFLGGHSYSQTTCPSKLNFIFNGSATYSSNCNTCDSHNNNPTSNPGSCYNTTGLSGETEYFDGTTNSEINSGLNSSPGEFQLTPNCDRHGGSMWNNIGLNLNNDFKIEAELYFGNNQFLAGSDGMGFVLQTDPNGTSFVTTGGSIGFGGISPSFIVEMDTYCNTPTCAGGGVNQFDLTNDHMAIMRNGNRDHSSNLNLFGPLQLENDGEIEDGTWKDFSFEWIAATKTFIVMFEGVTMFNQQYDISNNIFPNQNGIVFWGFTASTGAARNVHRIRNIVSNIPVDFNYDLTQYYNCTTYLSDDRKPIFSGQDVGTFSISPSTGMSIDQNTGEITTNGATVGLYTITFAFTDANGNSCTTTTDVEILDEDPDFGYSNNNSTSFCNSETNPSPSWVSNPGGTFSTTTGLLFVDVSSNTGSSTGEIDLANSTPGTYDITYETPICSNPKDREVIILASPNVDAGSDFSVCAGDQVTLTATGNANSYQWFTDIDLIYPVSPNTFITTDYVGYPKTFYVLGTGSNGCTAIDDVVVSLVTPNTVDAGSYNNICIGTPVTLAGSLTGTGTYSWDKNLGDGSFDDNTSLTAIYTPGTNDNANGNVTLTLEVDQGQPCGVRSDNTTINFTTTFGNNSVAINPTNPTPNDDLIANINTTCVDVSSNDWRLNGTSIAPLNFPFNTSGTSGLTSKSTSPELLSIIGASPTISEGISGNCFDFSSQGELEANITTISPSNGISISVWTYSSNLVSGYRRWVQLNSSIGSELLLRQTSTNIVEAVVWTDGSADWNGGDFIYENSQLQNNVWQHWVLTYDNANSMILYKNGGYDISVTGSQTFSTTTNEQEINDITQIKINTNSSGGWYNGKLDEVMVFDRVLTPQQAKALFNSGDPDYEKIVKEETNCGETWTLNSIPYNHIGNEGTATLSSSVSIPLVSISTQPSSGADVCLGTTASTMTVVASSGSGNYTYQWYTCQSDGSNPVIINGETNASFTPPTSSPGTTYYIVTVTDQDANCGSETSNVVSQKVDESITVDAGGDQTVCGNDVVNITGTITGGVSTGTWSASAAGTFGNTTDLSTTFTPGASLLGGGTVDITLTSASNGACPAVSDQLTLTINSADAGFSYAYSEYCSDETNPVPTITGDAGTFSSATGLVINSNTGEIDLTGSTAGTYTITYTLTGACPNSSTFDVTITTPTVGFNYGGQTSFCLGTTPPSVTYTAPTGGVFSSNNSNLVVNPTTGEIDLVNSLPGNYEITYDYSSINQLGADVTSNSFDLITYANGVSMNNIGDKIAVGFPYSSHEDGFSKIYKWNGSTWNQQGNNVRYGGSDAKSGESLAFDEDGDVFVSAKPRWCSTHSSTGAVRAFQWNGSAWVTKGSPILSDLFNINEDGYELKLNASGDVLAIAVKKDVNNSSFNIKSQVKIFEWDVVTSDWIQMGATLEGEDYGDRFGNSISLNSSGNRIAVGAPINDASNGEVKIFDWDGSSWILSKEFNGSTNSQLGFSVSLNNNGNILAISENTFNSNEGIVTIYEESAGVWSSIGSTINGNAGDKLGTEINLNATGDRVLVSSIEGLGFVKLFKNAGNSWALVATVTGVNNGDQFGKAIDLNANGDRFIVGAPYHDNGGVNNTGEAKVFQTSKTCPEPLSVTITELPVTAGTDFTICEGENYTLSASGGVTYSWSPTTGLDDHTSATPVATPTAGTYTYTVTGSDATGCSGTAQQVLTVLPNDVATFSYSSCCYPSDATDPQPTFSGTTGGNYTSSTGLSISSTTGEIDLDASVPGAYTVTYATSSSNACPASSSENILVMNSNNCNTVNFNVTGSAIDNGNNNYQVTPNQNSQVGAVWSQSPLNLNYPFHISAELNFGIKNTDGADGIVFVLQESSNTLTHNGGGIGYAVGSSNLNPGFNPSLGIEFDTHFNPSTDPPATNSTSNDHLAIQLNGDIDHSNSLISPVDLLDIEDGNNHPLTIFWDPNPDNDLSTVEGELKVYFDNQLVATLSRDLLSDFTSSNNGMVYWGFTGSTGGYNNTQVVNYLNSSFWFGRNPTTLSDNINEWQGDVSSPTESITDPIDNTTQYSTGSWFNPCNWSASFVPDYNTDVIIPQQTTYQQPSYINHPLVNYLTIPHFFGVFPQARVLNLDMDADGDVDSDDQIQGKAFAKSLQLEGDALFFIKTDDGAEIQVKD